MTHLSIKGRYIGLDVGSKTVGVAVSDTRHVIATPLKTLQRARFGPFVEDLKSLLEGYEIGAFVIGLPLHMSGEEGRAAQSVRHFGQNLQPHFKDTPLVFWDERLTTVGADWSLERAGVPSKKRKDVIDKIAASLILQGYLDHLERVNR